MKAEAGAEKSKSQKRHVGICVRVDWFIFSQRFFTRIEFALRAKQLGLLINSRLSASYESKSDFCHMFIFRSFLAVLSLA